MARAKPDCVARASALIAEALKRRRPRWVDENRKPPLALQRETGIRVLADWHLPDGLDPEAAETALKVLLGSGVKSLQLSAALVEAFAQASPALFAELSGRMLSAPLRRFHPVDVAFGMLSGFPPACIADWSILGSHVERSYAYHDRVARIEARIGADIFWVVSDATLDEIERQHGLAVAARRAARAAARAGAA